MQMLYRQIDILCTVLVCSLFHSLYSLSVKVKLTRIEPSFSCYNLTLLQNFLYHFSVFFNAARFSAGLKSPLFIPPGTMFPLPFLMGLSRELVRMSLLYFVKLSTLHSWPIPPTMKHTERSVNFVIT